MPTDANPVARRIRLAQQRGARRLSAMMDEAARELRGFHEQALEDLRRELAELVDSEGLIPLDRLPRVESLVRARLDDLARQHAALVNNRLRRSIGLAIDPWGVASEAGVDTGSIVDEVLDFLTNFTDDNGLQLSDRLWRVQRGARDRVTEAIERAVVQGQSAAQAARDLLLRGQPVPQDLMSKRGMAAVARVQAEMGDALLTGTGNPYFQAERVMRTEINRAYGETSIRAAAQHRDVTAVRFVLSPLHPETDICDFHAEANLHGLGPGVYPIDDHPWPAHPNTLSYLEPIFADEVTDEDRRSRETMTDFLNDQPAGKQDAILGGQAKGWAWRQGHMSPRQITTPWNKVRPQLQRRGIDIPERFAR